MPRGLEIVLSSGGPSPAARSSAMCSLRANVTSLRCGQHQHSLAQRPRDGHLLPVAQKSRWSECACLQRARRLLDEQPTYSQPRCEHAPLTGILRAWTHACNPSHYLSLSCTHPRPCLAMTGRCHAAYQRQMGEGSLHPTSRLWRAVRSASRRPLVDAERTGARSASE